MPKVLINYKVCDNSPACSGIEVCPSGALHWDAANKKIAYDESKCIGCGACANTCPVAQAIRFAKDDAGAVQIEKEFTNDPRRAEDLFVDRYGGDFALTQNTLPEDVLAAVRAIRGLAVLELNNEDLIRCLLMSIPMRELFGERSLWTHVKVMNPSDELLDELKVSELPAMVFFRDGMPFGKIEGYFENSESERALLTNKIKKVLG